MLNTEKNHTFNTITVVGLGYIGLPTATMFASRKKKVIGVDINQYAVDTVNQGKVHFFEPELDILVQAVVGSGFLRATTKPEPADAFLIVVPTPFSDGHKPDLSFVESAVRSIAPVLQKGNLVILESTSPVGTTEKIAEWLAADRPDLTFPQQTGEAADIQIAYCPERVLPGRVVHELVANDRAIGGMTRKASDMAIALYGTFVEGSMVPTTARTAEMCKLTENSYRDVNIAFANELSLLCDKLQINVWELISVANHHPRVKIFQPAAGVGGHCIAVDPWFIVDANPEESRLIRVAREVNDHKPEWVLDKIKAVITDAIAAKPGSTMADIKVACLGIAFKPDADDLRESPSLAITKKIGQFGCQVLVVEPNIETLPSKLAAPNVSQVPLNEALAVADVVCVLVKHRLFVSAMNEIKIHPRTVDAVGLFTYDRRRSNPTPPAQGQAAPA